MTSPAEGYLKNGSKFATITTSNFNPFKWETSALTFSDNTAVKAGSIKGTFADTFKRSDSSWSNSSFIITSIVDNANQSTSFTFTVSGIDGNTDISTFIVQFTDQSQFGNTSFT